MNICWSFLSGCSDYRLFDTLRALGLSNLFLCCVYVCMYTWIDISASGLADGWMDGYEAVFCLFCLCYVI